MILWSQCILMVLWMSNLFYKLAQTLNSVSNRSVQNVKMAYVVNTMKFLQILERERRIVICQYAIQFSRFVEYWQSRDNCLFSYDTPGLVNLSESILSICFDYSGNREWSRILTSTCLFMKGRRVYHRLASSKSFSFDSILRTI